MKRYAHHHQPVHILSKAVSTYGKARAQQLATMGNAIDVIRKTTPCLLYKHLPTEILHGDIILRIQSQPSSFNNTNNTTSTTTTLPLRHILDIKGKTAYRSTFSLIHFLTSAAAAASGKHKNDFKITILSAWTHQHHHQQQQQQQLDPTCLSIKWSTPLLCGLFNFSFDADSGLLRIHTVQLTDSPIPSPRLINDNIAHTSN